MQDLACFPDGSVWSWTIEWLEWWLNVVVWIWVSDLQCDLTWRYIQFWDGGFMFCPCVTIPWQTNGCLRDLAGQGKLQFIFIYMYSSLEWFMSPGTFSLFWTCIFHHISWYPWHILYSPSSLFRWHPTVAEYEVVEMENSTLNRAGVLWEDQDYISAAGKSVLPLLLPSYISLSYKSSNNHSWHCWLNNIHPSLLNSSSFRHFEALWNQLAHLPAPRAKFEEPVGILPRASHLQQNSQPSICGWPCQLLWRRNLWRQVPKWVWKPDNG